MLSIAFTGCALGTAPIQIAGVYVPDKEYADYGCKEAQNELKNLVNREKMLVDAQSKRVSTNTWQALWVGFGNGDGIEAAELAQIRGHRSALTAKINTMEKCNIPIYCQRMIEGFSSKPKPIIKSECHKVAGVCVD
jgi:hypothetical protein